MRGRKEGILMEINILKEYERVVVDVPESSCNELMLLICLRLTFF